MKTPNSLLFFFNKRLPVCSGLIMLMSSLVHAGDEPAVIIINADFQQTSVEELGASASAFGGETMAKREAQQLEDLLNLAPNVNFASGASRGRYIQIRGIGERGAFIEPVNYSVGVIVDGIDLTGISGAATLFDIQQVEVLRGPQGTLYGANALAGLVNIVSNAPSPYPEGGIELSLGNYDSANLNGYVSGPINTQAAYRVAFQRSVSDGYTDNSFLHRDDTSNIDERSFRTRFDWQAAHNLKLDLTILRADIDNGYDAFSLDNTRETLSDEPGHDRQLTEALALKTIWQLDNGNEFRALISHADSDIEYGFDEDWSFPEICSGQPCDGFEYSSFDNYLRDNSNLTLDLRLSNHADDSGPNWTIGTYLRRQNLDLLREYTFAANDFTSDYETFNRALYSEIKFPLSMRTRLITGLRYEQRDADYSDNSNRRLDNQASMWGGKIAIEHDLISGSLIYGLLSRGYKAGGFNTNASIPENLREYDQETMLNYEIGIKGDWFEERLQAQLALFYQDRDDIQIDQSFVEPLSGSDCPCSFEDYIDNAASGINYGVEVEFDWLLADDVTLFGSLGLLQTRFKDFVSFSHVDADATTGAGVDMDGREQAHAPNWQYTIGIDYYLGNYWSLTIDSEGKDAFFFGDGHDQKSDAYQLYNARLSWRRFDWSFAVWIRNLTDEDYYTRGFGSFGNDPRKFYETEPYYQFGAPQTYGITTAYRF